MVGRTRSGKLTPWQASDYGRSYDVPGIGLRKQNSRSSTSKRQTRAILARRKRNAVTEEVGSLPTERPAQKMKTRSVVITCLHYGPDRKVDWPNHLFCQPCDWWENECSAGKVQEGGKRSRRFACELRHCHPLNPTILKCSQSKMIEDDQQTDTTPLVVAESDTPVSPGNISDPQNDINIPRQHLLPNDVPPQNDHYCDELLIQCTEQQNTINKLRADIYRLRHEKSKLTQLVAEPLEGLKERLQSKMGQARKRKLVSDVLLLFFLDNVCKAACLTTLTRHVVENIYSDFAVLRVMDREGGKLNYQSLQLLSNLEKEYKGTMEVPYAGSILPTVYGLKKAAAKVECVGKYTVPFKMSRTSLGAEAIEFRPSDVSAAILSGYGLSEVAKDDSEATLAQAIDGSRFSKALGFVMYGFKVTDYRAMNPDTMEPLITANGSTTMQSRNNQYPVKMVIGRESASMYEEFRDIIRTSTQLSGNDITNDGVFCDRKISLSNICTDLSATWKATGVGGAVKNATFFCHCYSTRSSQCATANATHCSRFCSGKDPSWKCFHKQFLDEATVERSKKEMASMLQVPLGTGLNDIVSYTKQTQLLRAGEDAENPTETSTSDCGSVHFDLHKCTDHGTKVQYSILINSDLELRKMSTAGSLSSRQRRLKEAFVREKKFLLLCDAVEHGSKRAEALFLTLNNPPCILHLQNRVCLKKLTVVFNRGVNNALRGTFDERLFSANDDVRPSNTSRFSRFVSGLENLFNTQIWGTNFAPTHWCLPHDKKTLSLLTISLDNVKCKSAMAKFGLVADYCLTVEEGKEDYIKCIGLLELLMVKLRKRTKFTDNEIYSFQSTVDEWYQIWHRLENDHGVTNYIHLLSSGHVSDYLFSHRNLYAFSNQGWEAFNSLIKQVFFRRTARGGGQDYNMRSRLLPLARWLQRRMVFLQVKTEEQLENRLHEYESLGEPIQSDEVQIDDFYIGEVEAEFI